MGAFTILLYSIPCSLVLTPCLRNLLLFLAQPILRVLWDRFGDHFTWPSGSQFLHRGHRPTAAPSVDGSCSRCYRRGAPGEEAAGGLDLPVRCVFCLCDMEDGEEVREVRCQHLFHSSCLDRWVGFGRATCPLCRQSLANHVAEAELPCDEDVQLRPSALMLVVLLPGGAWYARLLRA